MQWTWIDIRSRLLTIAEFHQHTSLGLLLNIIHVYINYKLSAALSNMSDPEQQALDVVSRTSRRYEEAVKYVLPALSSTLPYMLTLTSTATRIASSS